MTSSAVLFDIGGVVVTDGPDLARVAQSLGLPEDSDNVERVGRAVWAERDRYDLDLSDADYWTAVAARAGAVPPTPATIADLTAADVARWSRPRADVVRLIDDLVQADVPLGVLSNAPRSFVRGFTGQAWTNVFRCTTFSCNTGVAKPDPRSYEAAVSCFGIPARDVIFFDDRSGNVEAGRRAGLDARLWHGVTDARAVLIDRGILTQG